MIIFLSVLILGLVTALTFVELDSKGSSSGDQDAYIKQLEDQNAEL